MRHRFAHPSSFAGRPHGIAERAAAGRGQRPAGIGKPVEQRRQLEKAPCLRNDDDERRPAGRMKPHHFRLDELRVQPGSIGKVVGIETRQKTNVQVAGKGGMVIVLPHPACQQLILDRRAASGRSRGHEGDQRGTVADGDENGGFGRKRIRQRNGRRLCRRFMRHRVRGDGVE
ncbi:hypothetical protein NOF55_02610 [Rhizobiaceae bacterium BDR2-2]|uniref:Uncharacterized protein n=1 Tax=Ectorhizobium quercum TaxID=2965071 RepID=A0AAE3MVK1_9HYPH|nr:hypothetical protein [Ectorhizobium quercum]MCX8995988.1 hypothetical protein [Ectorhizobium quercum]